MKSKKPYHLRQDYKSDRQRRARKPLYNSRLPKFITNLEVVQKFMHLSKKRRIGLVAWGGGSALVVIALFTTVYYANTLGSKDRIMNRNKTGVTLQDQTDQTIAQFFNARQTQYVPLSQIAPIAQKSAISSEDKNFYNEPGFSVKGIGFALWQNIKPGGSRGGGSTLTQQLVASSLLNKKRSVLRKYQELVLSIEIERRYSKDEILEMYLNSVYFGEGSFGIEDAAQTYYGKSAKDLDTAQATMLIGLLPAPSAYSPISGDANKAKIRQTYVLGRLVTDHVLTEADQAAASTEALSYAPKKEEESQKAPHFALMVKDELIKKYGEEKVARSGYVVKTTLSLDWQAKAEAAVATQVNKLAKSNVSNGSAVVIDPKTGEIRALVGSKDWNNPTFGKYNIATATRQPGSSFKPIMYATGLENKDFSAETTFHDVATDFNGYAPKDYDLKYRGDVTLRRALSNSLNIPAVEALQKVGINTTIASAEKMGLSTFDKTVSYGLPMALGTAPAKLTEMTNAYATFANAGEHNDITTISTITDKNNKVIFKDKPKNKQVISAQTSYIMSSILSDNTARAEEFGSSLNLSGGRLAAVKTGTTEDYADAWTIGYTPSLAIGVWIGNNDYAQKMSRVAGSSGAAPIWKSLMQQLLAGTPNEKFVVPTGLTVRSVCRNNGALAETTGSNTITEYFIPGTLPTTTCNESQKTTQETTPVIVPKQDNSTTNQDSSGQGNNGSSSGNSGGTTIPVIPTNPPASP
jgi:1A family penicillin-binding protein